MCHLSAISRLQVFFEQCSILAAAGKMIGLYEIWKKQPFLFSSHPGKLLVEYFPVYLSIICASSGRPLSHYVLHLWSKCLLEMSHHKGRWKVGVTISELFIASPTWMKVSHLKSPPQNAKGFFPVGICITSKHCSCMRRQRTFWSESIKNASHNLTSCYVPSLCDSVVFRSFLTSVCLCLFGSGDRSTCSTLLLPWKYPGRLSAL